MKKLNLDLFENALFQDAVQLKAVVGGYTGISYTVTGTSTAGGRTMEDRRYDTQHVCNVVVDYTSQEG
jgi:hypothetical protein